MRCTVVRVVIAGLMWLAATSAGLGVAAAQVDTGRAESKEWRIRISVPEEWRYSMQSSYPRVIVWMYRSKPDGTMTLTAERGQGISASIAFARQTVTELGRLGYQIETAPQVHAATQAAWIEFSDGRTFSRQAFLILGDTVYVLTLSAPDERTRSQHLRAFDYALRSMERTESDDSEPAATPEASEFDDLVCEPGS
ncbi:hypothetical protein [Haliangium ochraceum]|uniref:PsbP C-terminal domain-containing protein n=1 Tax=Haliangium ochraceum (strain DSM 14365 / JCM 11303 / SMP-2) TaxID=502025 RepID=D0LU38_HALO1|nr:hypothetical protein [Haliangium ochraceum]ACY17402.1 hypothetical protein Hoch_4913 [Haliangium ochraceum DSM 14365]